MARIRSRPRPKASARPPAKAPRPSVGRRRKRPSPLAALSHFFFRLEAIGIGLLVLALVAIPWLLPAARGVTDLRDGFVRTFGLLTFVLIVLLAYSGLAIVRRRYDQAFASWRPWAIGLTVMLFVAGVLGFLRPAWQLGDVFLDEVTAGGNLGHQLATTPIGLLLWLASGIAVFALISPAGAAATVRRLGAGARAVWGSNLPSRGWRSARALTNLVFPTRVPPQGTDKVPLDSVIWAQQSEPKAAAPLGTPDHADEPSASEPPADVGEQARMPLDGDDEQDLDPAPGGRRKAHDGWRLPALDMLADGKTSDTKADGADRARLITETLASFGVDARVVQVNEGPTVTQFGIEPGWEVKTRRVAERDASGRPVQDADGNTKMRTEEVSRTRVRVNQITTLANDLALALAAPSLRIESPVPGKPFVGIEVPNSTATLVTLRGVVESAQFKRLSRRTRLGLALGTSVSGEASVADLAKMPHLLIAGATGSGKSVCINAIIACILMHASPEEVRFVMIDPKRVELAAFAKIPHLAFSSIITEVDQVVGTLQAVIHEMESRYRRFASISVRNIESYNRHPECPQKLPSWVVIIDELADLMMAAPYEVERQICRLAQLARATGIHLIVATQRPSVDVITGLIKANFPTRIAFAMSSQVDSRTILDGAGAEKLLGRGDMLYLSTDASKPKRLQGVYVSDEEIEQLVQFWTQDRFQNVERETFDHLLEEAKQSASELPTGDDPMFERAQELAEQHQRVSASMLQRRLRIGYPRAARLMDMLEARGVVGPAEGQGSRAVLSGEEAAPEAVEAAAPAGAPTGAADSNVPE